MKPAGKAKDAPRHFQGASFAFVCSSDGQDVKGDHCKDHRHARINIESHCSWHLLSAGIPEHLPRDRAPDRERIREASRDRKRVGRALSRADGPLGRPPAATTQQESRHEETGNTQKCWTPEPSDINMEVKATGNLKRKGEGMAKLKIVKGSEKEADVICGARDNSDSTTRCTLPNGHSGSHVGYDRWNSRSGVGIINIPSSRSMALAEIIP